VLVFVWILANHRFSVVLFISVWTVGLTQKTDSSSTLVLVLQV